MRLAASLILLIISLDQLLDAHIFQSGLNPNVFVGFYLFVEQIYLIDGDLQRRDDVLVVIKSFGRRVDHDLGVIL